MIRLFRVSIPVSVLTLVLSDTLLLFGLYLAGTFLGFPEDPAFYVWEEGGWLRIAIVVAIIQGGLYFQDSYDEIRDRGHLLFQVQELCVAIGIAFLFQAILGYGRWSLQLHKWAMVNGSLLSLVVMPLWRKLFTLVVQRALPAERVLFLGSSSVMKQLGERIKQRPEIGIVVIGYVDDDEGITDFPAPRLGSLSELKRIAEEMRPSRIIVGKTERRGYLPMEQLMDLRFAGIHIEEAATMYETILGRISVADLRPSQIVFSTALGPRARNVRIQNVYSVMLGIIGSVLSLPVMIIVAVLVRLSSPGPILYRQKRVGMHGTVFEVYKFRSMYANAEGKTGAVWAKKGDPRITPIGNWLRKLRLDELPQFFNVVRGEMAVAGPRPERPEFCKILEEKIPFYRQRHAVKPGITGWAQINHDYADTIEDSMTKFEYDLYYIKNLTPSLDAYILFHTLKVMLLSRGSR